LRADEIVGGTLLINPGAIMGYNGGELKEIQPTFLVLDCALLKAQVYTL
jgi:hypothetical protein